MQTLSVEHRVIMKFREWMLSKGYISMGTMMKIKKRLLYHGHSDDQAKFVPLYHGHIVEGQAPMCIGTKRAQTQQIILFYTEVE